MQARSQAEARKPGLQHHMGLDATKLMNLTTLESTLKCFTIDAIRTTGRGPEVIKRFS